MAGVCPGGHLKTTKSAAGALCFLVISQPVMPAKGTEERGEEPRGRKTAKTSLGNVKEAPESAPEVRASRVSGGEAKESSRQV